ncbi:hypothetical protein LTR56_004575 [Elasticomyces elasticus]|nr:hypothetical protein LTR56_004575 [Elasticomyces elasticus]KAK4925914.1 hypothetical protein LTR49_007052 [Elasticomyces elasticus]KAK5768151.1 hypothetical protein LTS12_001635 [Elasticomyces elasticus]
MAAHVQWTGRPASKEHEHPYRAPPAPSNPVVRGLPLYYGAKIITSSTLIQNLLWGNAGFDSLRNRAELEGVEPRYEPLVVKSSGTRVSTAEALQMLSNEDWTSRTPSEKLYPSILDYHEAYKTGRTTPTAVAKVLLPLVRRDVEIPSKHSVAFLSSKVELVMRAAEASTKRYEEGKSLGPLDGVPVAVKDEEDVTGYPKCVGSKLDLKDKHDATSYCVKAWQDAGAVLIGKTNMHEYGMDTTNNNPNHGTPLNPHNDTYYCGGSSGGSAYAVGAGLVPVAIGNDGGGSIRIPSAYCGLYGLKPSHGRVSIRPTSNLARSNGVAGPLAANMVDLEISYRVMAQPDLQEPDSALFDTPSSAVTHGRKKVLGIFTEWFDRADPAVRQACMNVIDYLTSKLDYEIVDISIPMLHEGQTAHAMTILCEIPSGVSSLKDLTPANQVLMSVGSKTLGVDFLQAQKMRMLLMQHLAHLYEKHPGMIIVTPTTPNAGWNFDLQDLKYGCSNGNMSLRSMEYVWLANFTGCPAISVPAAYLGPEKGTGRIPIGFMGMGEWCSEDELLAFGYDCERYLHDVYENGRVKPATYVELLEAATTQAEP